MSNVVSRENRGPIGPDEFLRRREKLGKAQADMAEALGVSQQAISHWENGRRRVPDWVPKLLRYVEGVAERDAKAASQSSTSEEDGNLIGARPIWAGFRGPRLPKARFHCRAWEGPLLDPPLLGSRRAR